MPRKRLKRRRKVAKKKVRRAVKPKQKVRKRRRAAVKKARRVLKGIRLAAKRANRGHLTVSELAKRYYVSPRTVQRWKAAGLASKCAGGIHLFKPKTVENWLLYGRRRKRASN